MQTQEDALTVPILRQTGHVLDALELPSQDLFERFDKAVSDPPGEFVEGNEVISLLISSRGMLLERVARPDIAEGFSA